MRAYVTTKIVVEREFQTKHSHLSEHIKANKISASLIVVVNISIPFHFMYVIDYQLPVLQSAIWYRQHSKCYIVLVIV